MTSLESVSSQETQIPNPAGAKLQWNAVTDETIKSNYIDFMNEITNAKSEVLLKLQSEGWTTRQETILRPDGKGSTVEIATDPRGNDVLRYDRDSGEVEKFGSPSEADSSESSVMGIKMPFVAAHLLEGVTWAVAVVGLVQLIGGLAGLDKSLTTALSASLGGGVFMAKAWYAAFGGQHSIFGDIGSFMSSGWTAAGFGLVIAATIFVLMYKKEYN